MSSFVINPYVFGAPDPEAGLTLTSTHAYNTRFTAFSGAARGQDAVFACDFTVPASPSGLIFEGGGSAAGCSVAFRAGGEFVIRASDGSLTAPTASANDNAVLYLTSGQPSGAGTLVWEFKVADGRIRAWWNSVSLGTATSSNGVFRSALWAGTDDFCYFRVDGNLPLGEPAAALPATGISSLRYYQNQLVSL
jgi:hypothetical protein